MFLCVIRFVLLFVHVLLLLVVCVCACSSFLLLVIMCVGVRFVSCVCVSMCSFVLRNFEVHDSARVENPIIIHRGVL